MARLKLLPWRRIVLTLAVLLGLAAAFLFWPVREDLSALAAVGARYDARILRDSWGVPHIFGQTDPDVAYGLAYAHAEDDFLTIQQTLLAGRGQLASVEGPDSAPIDYFVHLLRIWEVVDARYETDLSPEARALMAAYADGLNHYAALHAAEALPGLFPLTGRDIVASSMLKAPLFFGLDDTLAELYKDTRQQPVSTRTLTDLSGLPGLTGMPIANSNTFAVAPSRTANGETFLAINSHQPWTGPVAWYEAHLHSEAGWDAVGGLFPGTPVIIHGHNRDLGWAFTVSHPDLTDVYVLEINPENPNQYRFDGEWRDLEVREATLTVKLLGNLKWPVKQEVLWSVYGPTVRRPHGTYAIRFPGMDQLGIFEQLYRMNKARSLEEWQAAMRMGQLTMFNVGYADRAGNIYYLYNGRLPIRTAGYDWTQYLPGNTSETLWTETLPFDDLPQVLNPPAGFIQNANSSPFTTTVGLGNPDPGRYAASLGIDLEMTNRSLRMLELLSADPEITAADFLAYKFDMAFSDASDLAVYQRMLAEAPPPAEAEVRAAIEVVRRWDRRVDPENPAAALMVLTMHFLHERTDQRVDGWVGHVVTRPELMEAFAASVAHLQKHFGRVDVPWAEVNRLVRGELTLGLGGAPDVLHAVYGELQADGRLTGIAGDCYVLLVTWDQAGRVSAQSIHQYGAATLVPRSPHYADQAPLFARRELKPVWLDEAEIRAHLEREYRPGEAAPGGGP